MSRHDLIRIALAFDSDPRDVRIAVANFLSGFGEYGAGAAASLLRLHRAPTFRFTRETV